MEQLLQSEPLHARKLVRNVFSNWENRWLHFPDDLRLHCDHEHCGGERRYHTEDKSSSFKVNHESLLYAFVLYRCTTCRAAAKLFGVRVDANPGPTDAFCTKIYEEPAFGRPIPKRLFSVIGEANRESFLQARRAIARGLGIGAYAYYRRIIENTKFDLITSVLEVARATNATPEQVAALESARTERQFSKAIATLQDAASIPPILLIEGHNPLTLIHDLLSEGIHKLTDAECLERAQQAEVVLCEIANRMQLALIERKEVKAAIASIMGRKRDAPETL